MGLDLYIYHSKNKISEDILNELKEVRNDDEEKFEEILMNNEIKLEGTFRNTWALYNSIQRTDEKMFNLIDIDVLNNRFADLHHELQNAEKNLEKFKSIPFIAQSVSMLDEYMTAIEERENDIDDLRYYYNNLKHICVCVENGGCLYYLASY